MVGVAVDVKDPMTTYPLFDDTPGEWILATPGKHEYTMTVDGLAPETKYFARAAVDAMGITTWGDLVSFTTQEQQFESVDLGLPSGIKWASCNLGASVPEGYGDYYAWGATEPWYIGDSQSPSSWKKNRGYTWANCPFNGGSSEYSESYWNVHKSECIDANNVLLPANDVAHVKLGGGWRMPTKDEWKELANPDNCSWVLTSLKGITGYKVQSKKSGHTDKWIFLPAAGCMEWSYLDIVGNFGRYWSSSLYTDSPSNAWYLFFSSDSEYYARGNERYSGLSVRPVYSNGGGKEERVTAVSLNKTTLSLIAGSSETLVATVTPSTASNRNVTWSSSKTGVATVDENGKVTANAKGSATITVKTADGAKTATCAVTVINPATPDAVDLGLSVKWASFNLGATKPEDYGGYYQWAGTEDVTDTSIYLYWDNCPYHSGSSDSSGWTKYIPSSESSFWSGTGAPDNKTVLDPDDDVAHVTLGGKWRMPTDAEWTELRDNCTWTWTSDYKGTGIPGRIVTSNKSGYTDKSIFLPAAGWRDNGSLDDVGSDGIYWSSSLETDFPRNACYMYFYSGSVYTDCSCGRCYGLSVRPVSE